MFGGTAVNIQAFGAEKGDIGNIEECGKNAFDVIKTEVVIADITACGGQIDCFFYVGQTVGNTFFVVAESKFVDADMFDIKFE